MRRRVIGIMVAMAALVVAGAGCGVVDDGKVDRIDPPFGLDDTTTSTSTTSTTIQLVSTTSISTTTTEGVESEQVRLYFISGGQLTYVDRPLTSPVLLSQAIAALQEGPPEAGIQLRSALPANVPIEVRTDGRGVAIVTLPEGFFDTIPVGDQRMVIGQIVMTLLERAGIGQVQFNQAVPKPPLGELVAAGELLTRLDYETLLPTASGSTFTTLATSATTSTTATTTVP
ncbi:MAG: GerMN domain-containing protein [Actinomycetota bacterium]|nr:GerMN domain-containing protein [Actinomycetota bacterium]